MEALIYLLALFVGLTVLAFTVFKSEEVEPVLGGSGGGEVRPREVLTGDGAS